MSTATLDRIETTNSAETAGTPAEITVSPAYGYDDGFDWARWERCMGIRF